MSFQPTIEMGRVLSASTKMNRYAHCDECGYFENPSACKREGDCANQTFEAYEELKEAMEDEQRYRMTRWSNARELAHLSRRRRLEDYQKELGEKKELLVELHLKQEAKMITQEERGEMREAKERVDFLEDSIKAHTTILAKETEHKKLWRVEEPYHITPSYSY